MKRVCLGIGSNLTPDGFTSSLAGCEAAIAALADTGFNDIRTSSWFETAPVPVSNQPWFVNAVVVAYTNMSARLVLQSLHIIEAQFGRVRGIQNAARVLDIDLLDYDGVILDEDDIKLPHPRMHERAFVLQPLAEVLPRWSHPVTGRPITELIAQAPECQKIFRTQIK